MATPHGLVVPNIKDVQVGWWQKGGYAPVRWREMHVRSSVAAQPLAACMRWPRLWPWINTQQNCACM